MELPEYNGWENRFTWLMHLHLSNEQALEHEVMGLVATTSSNRKAGRFLATWVKAMVFNWLCVHPEREARFDGNMQLLAWDLAGSALSYAEWHELIAWLAGRGKKSKNLFTVTLYQFIHSDGRLLSFVQDMLRAYPNSYQCTDRLSDWFREQVEAVVYGGGEEVPLHTPMSALVNELVENAYSVIAWEHVARAFRPG